MKKSIHLFAALTLFTTFACTPTEKKADVPPPPTAPLQQAAPAAPGEEPKTSGEIVQGYASGLTGAAGKARAAGAKVEIDAIGTAIRDYQFENSKYPASLDDIKDRLSPDMDLSKYVYHPDTGTVAPK